MKTQMRFQKILMLVSLIIGAFSVVYALIFCSGIMNQVAAILEYDTLDADGYYKLGATDLYYASQDFSDLFLILGIILICAVVLLYIAACNKRRKYYITNYIATGIAVVYMIVYAVLLIINLSFMQYWVSQVQFDECKYYYLTYALESRGAWNESTWMITLGFVLFGLVILDAIALVLNVVWKIKLMQGEKKLIEQGKAVEIQTEVA